MKVLSLFDGMSCGKVALGRAGVPVSAYYSSEIDKYAIQVADKNYPDNIKLGDVLNWPFWSIPWEEIDLVLGGFPCQAWSIAGKMKGVDDPRGMLFFDMLDIMKYVLERNPKAKFFIENVRMKKEHMDFISEYIQKKLGDHELYNFNSNLVSAQNRNRYYWTNILDVDPPKDEGILLEDIVHENVEASAVGKNLKALGLDANCFKAGVSPLQQSEKTKILEKLKEYIVPLKGTLKILEQETKAGKIGYFGKDSQANRVYQIHGKAVTLCGEAGGGAAKMGQYLFGCITPDRIYKRQNGRRFNLGDKFYTLTAQDKHGILTEGYIRKLTPIECERLQTLPDNYTKGVSDAQRYKMLGNGWTVDIIAHIFKKLHPPLSEKPPQSGESE